MHIRECPDNPNRVSNVSKKNKEDFNEGDDATNTMPQEPIRIVEEDDSWYRVIVKPQGMATMGVTEQDVETLINSPAMMIDPNRKKYRKAVPCHRLDRATGGLVLCSKSKAAEVSLTTCFRLHEVKKRYRAIVRGTLEPLEGTINAPVDGQPSETKYKVVCCTPSYQYGTVTTVDLWPVTGRRHQLRKHLLGTGHPILGDHRYSSALDWPHAPYTNTLFLWALEIEFPHKGGITPISVQDNASAPIGSSTKQGVPSEPSQSYPAVRVEIPEPAYYEEFRRIHAITTDAKSTA